MKILIAEDDRTTALLLQQMLKTGNYQSTIAYNGAEAIAYAIKESFDIVLTDWMMPGIDGIELVKHLRANIKPIPIIIFITSLSSPEARSYAIECGADDYLVKPVKRAEVLSILENCASRKQQPVPVKKIKRTTLLQIPVTPPPSKIPDFVGVGITASTDGPAVIQQIIRKFSPDLPIAYFIAQHGPEWIIETFAAILQQETSLPVHLAIDKMPITRGNIYIAPGGKQHVLINSFPPQIRLVEGPPENYMYSSANPLLRSLAKVFKNRSIAVILTGIGRDGALGAEQVSTAGGVVFAQDPQTATSPSMPQTVIDLGCVKSTLPIESIASEIINTVKDMMLDK